MLSWYRTKWGDSLQPTRRKIFSEEGKKREGVQENPDA